RYTSRTTSSSSTISTLWLVIMFIRCLLNGQFNHESRSFAHLCFEPYLSAVLLDDHRTSNCQTLSGSLPDLFSRKERLEYLVLHAAVDAAPRVGNPNFDGSVLSLRGNRDLAPFTALSDNAGNRVGRVD